MSVRFGDLVLDSEIALPALPRSTSEAPGCCIRLNKPGRFAHDAQRWDHHWLTLAGVVALSCARDGENYRLGVPGLATFVVRDAGAIVECRPEPGLPAETLEHLLLDQVLPRVLTHRGRLVVHAGCVVTPAGAIGFLGESGAGKSTLCAAFARDGEALLGDDGIVVRRAASTGFEAIATYPGLRLFVDPIERLLGPGAGSTAVAHTTEKRRVVVGDGVARMVPGPSPLIALYLLDATARGDDGTEISIERQTPREALVTLLRGSYQLHLVDAVRSREQLARVADLADAIPVSRLSYPRDLSRLPDVLAAIRADTSTLTLAGAAGCERH